MSTQLAYYTEPITDDELGFLVRKARHDRKQFYRVYAIFIVASIVVPYIGSWYRDTDDSPNTFSWIKFFVSSGVLFSITTLAVFLAFRRNLSKLQRDIRERSKTIYITHVTRKMQVPSNATFHLYLDSPIKLSIEVSAADYLHFNEGDEVAIEFATYSNEYLGYF